MQNVTFAIYRYRCQLTYLYNRKLKKLFDIFLFDLYNILRYKVTYKVH